MGIFCIDIGNTHAHHGFVDAQGAVAEQGEVETRLIDHPTEGVGPVIARQLAGGGLSAVAFCSVVPAATVLLRRLAGDMRLEIPLFELTCKQELGIAISYPKPAEVGQDRLANAVAVKSLGGLPAVVIDMGTAVTFDVITKERGYEGGIIAPGLELMRRYLHERTAQLPLLDDALHFPGAIGHSTADAMRIGTTVGFVGMVQALLDTVLAELEKRNAGQVAVYATGGCADYIRDNLRQKCTVVPELTLLGLAAACRLNIGGAA